MFIAADYRMIRDYFTTRNRSLREFLEYYNHERCHSGLDGRRIDPRLEPPDGEIRMFPRLGG